MRLTTLVVAVHYTAGLKMLSLDSMSCCPILLDLIDLPMAIQTAIRSTGSRQIGHMVVHETITGCEVC